MASEIEKVKALVQMTALTEEKELTCGEAYEVLEQFAEALLSGENVAELMPEVRRHLELCMDCREELDILLEALKAVPS